MKAHVYVERQYAVVLEFLSTGEIVAQVPELPGCMTQADSREEVLSLLKEAIEGYIAILREDGDLGEHC